MVACSSSHRTTKEYDVTRCKKGRPQKRTTTTKCLNCGDVTERPGIQFARSAAPRCYRCGGQLDKMRHLKQMSTLPKDHVVGKPPVRR